MPVLIAYGCVSTFQNYMTDVSGIRTIEPNIETVDMAGFGNMGG